MGDPTKGIYNKFLVQRRDGKSEPGEKHSACFHFVLDVVHDKYAAPALKAYADACREEYPLLADDIYRMMKDKFKKEGLL